nr:MAG TPA: hypothetical protein [Caudoviricetes sp.]
MRNYTVNHLLVLNIIIILVWYGKRLRIAMWILQNCVLLRSE